MIHGGARGMNDERPKSPSGRPIDVRPILRSDLGRVVLRCLPDGGKIEALFATQGTIGIAAWDGETCVGLLHGYDLNLPGGMNPYWPEWSRSWWLPDVLSGDPPLAGRVWCHACCHVSRTLEAASVSDDPDPKYFGRGIGTALCKASVGWARENGYAAIVAEGKPDNLFKLAVWHGGLPWTTHARMGFETVRAEVEGDELPDWAQGNSPPEVMKEVKEALVSGRPQGDFRCRLMMLRIAGA